MWKAHGTIFIALYSGVSCPWQVEKGEGLSRTCLAATTTAQPIDWPSNITQQGLGHCYRLDTKSDMMLLYMLSTPGELSGNLCLLGNWPWLQTHYSKCMYKISFFNQALFFFFTCLHVKRTHFIKYHHIMNNKTNQSKPIKLKTEKQT